MAEQDLASAEQALATARGNNDQAAINGEKLFTYHQSIYQYFKMLQRIVFLIVSQCVVAAQAQVAAAKEKLMMLNETIATADHEFDMKEMRLEELRAGLPDLPTPAPEGGGGNGNNGRPSKFTS